MIFRLKQAEERMSPFIQEIRKMIMVNISTNDYELSNSSAITLAKTNKN